MTPVNFQQYLYYPALQCGFSEHLAYQKLSNEDKDAILPIFELSQRGFDADLNTGISVIKESAGDRPFLLDLCKDAAPAPFISKTKEPSKEDEERIAKQRKAQKAYNGILANLLKSDDGFANWRELAGKFPSGIPVLQFRDAAVEQFAILRQGALFLKSLSNIAIRVTEESGPAAAAAIIQLIAILDEGDELLVILDCGQGRQRKSEREEFAQKTASDILAGIDIQQASQVSFACLSNTFTNPNKTGLYDYPGFEWEIWEEASQHNPMLFGDYGATHRLKRSNTYMPSDWIASVVYPQDEGWVVYRHENARDADGWIKGAKEVVAHEPHQALDAWGYEMLANAAKGRIEGVDSARFWHAAKINMHIHRQIGYAAGNLAGLGDDDDA